MYMAILFLLLGPNGNGVPDVPVAEIDLDYASASHSYFRNNETPPWVHLEENSDELDDSGA